MADDRETRQIVRIYSFHAEDRLPSSSNAHTLARVLSDREPSLEDIVAPWRKFYEPWEAQDAESDPITAVLSVEAARLQERWREFQMTSTKEERVDLKTSEPTIQGVIGMVAEVGKVWDKKRGKGKRGKATRLFHRLCGTLDAHSNILELIPRGNEYVSLFSGTLTSIIKASVNHETIVEELAQALCEISEHVADCEVELELFQTEEMRRAVADLYAHIFLFLTDALDWYMKKRRKRLTDSFNERFLKEFEDEIENIKRMSIRIKRKAAQGVAAEQRVTRLVGQETHRDLRIGLEGVRREQAEFKFSAEQFSDQVRRDRADQRDRDVYMAKLVENLTNFLTNSAQAHVFEDPTLMLASNFLAPGSRRVSRGESENSASLMTREELALNSAHLEDLFHRDRVRLDLDCFAPIPVDPEGLGHIAEWAKSKESLMLGILGPYFEGEDFENPMTLLAARFIQFAADASVPIMSYFCELRRGEPLLTGNTMEMQGLVQLVYGLMRQMIELVLPEFECSSNLSADRFKKLDGTVSTWEDTIVLFNDLARILPGQIFCVIDGFQWLDDRSTAPCLLNLVKALRSDKFKVLFTAAGQSRCLMDCLGRPELILLDKPLRKMDSSSWTLDELDGRSEA